MAKGRGSGGKRQKSRKPFRKGQKARGKKRDAARKVDPEDLLNNYWLKSGDEKAKQRVEESRKKETESALDSYWKRKGETKEEEKKEDEKKD